MGMLKKAASGVLAPLPCSRTMSTLRFATTVAPDGTPQAILRPCCTDFFDHSHRLLIPVSARVFRCFVGEIINIPIMANVFKASQDKPGRL